MYVLVRTLRIERSLSEDPVGFEECIEKGMILNLKQWGSCGNNVDPMEIALIFFTDSF